uniref:Immunoglobulin domain-containing protein n=1 Tax=Astyanax mexicanus TaxID=7994 RepID=A0A8B9H1V3_ASTMX
MKILLIFTLYLISGGGASSEVRGYSGGGVLIKCKYDKEYTSNNKYFCKSSGVNCTDLIRTGDQEKSVNTGRFLLIDKPRSAEFLVMMRELTVEDSGRYQCGVNISSNTYNHIQVELKINRDQHHEKCIDAVRYKGGSLNISCKYPQSLKDHPKFFCIRMGSGCLYKAAVKESKIWTTIGKFSLYDNRETEIFTVRFNNLTKRDSAEYWCGAESDWESDHGYKVFFTQINLSINGTQEMTSSSTSLSFPTQCKKETTSKPTSTSSTEANPQTEQGTQEMTSPTQSTKETTSNPTSTSSTEANPQTGPLLIPVVSVVLVLFLSGLFCFIRAQRKRRNNPG